MTTKNDSKQEPRRELALRKETIRDLAPKTKNDAIRGGGINRSHAAFDCVPSFRISC